MDDRNPFEGIRSATILKPGDRVLVEMGDGCTPKMLDKIADAMKTRFPDMEFTLLAGAHIVVVAPAATPVQPVSQSIPEEDDRA